MLVRSIRRSDRPHIAALQIESWRDSYTEALPGTYLTGQLAKDLQHHWHKVQIQPQDIVLVAEEKSIIGFIADLLSYSSSCSSSSAFVTQKL